MDQNHLSLHRHPEKSREVVEEETLLILQEIASDFLLEIGRSRIKVDVLRS